MSYNVDFCRLLLEIARRDAKAYGVEIPRGLTAMRSGGRRQWFVQGIDDAGLYVSADNAYHARAEYISQRIRERNPQIDEEERGTA